MKKPKSKLRVYKEISKTQQTTHWDLDYMTNAQIEALLEKTRGRSSERKKIRMTVITLGLILIILIVLGFLFSNYPS
jgi:hypothetical protein